MLGYLPHDVVPAIVGGPLSVIATRRTYADVSRCKFEVTYSALHRMAQTYITTR